MNKHVRNFFGVIIIFLFWSYPLFVFAQLDIGYATGKFLKDIVVDQNEFHYFLTHHNNVQVFNKDRQFVRQFDVTHAGQFPDLNAIKIDGDGVLHILDDANDLIHVYTTQGILLRHISLQAGGYYDMDIDDDGNYYLADGYLNVVRVFNNSGIKQKEFGSEIFGGLFSIHVSGSGDIYTCDFGGYNGREAADRVFDNDGNLITRIDVERGVGDRYYQEPRAIETDADGYVYIFNGSKISKYRPSPSFQLMMEYNIPDFLLGTGHAFYIKGGKIFIADAYQGVQVFTINGDIGSHLYSISDFSSNDGVLNVPEGAAVDKNNRIYVLDKNNYRIQVFDERGNFLFKFGSYGLGDNQFSLLTDIAVDSENEWVYVLDFNVIKRFNLNGDFIDTFSAEDATTSIAVAENGFLCTMSFQKMVIYSSPNVVYTSVRLINGTSFSIGPDNLIYTIRPITVRDNRIQVYNLNGNLIREFTLSTSHAGMYGIAVTDNFIFTAGSNRICKYDKNGTFLAELNSRGESVANVNHTLPNYEIYWPRLAILGSQLLISDVLRVQSVPFEQQISFPQLSPKRYGDESFLSQASSSAGLPITLVSDNPEVASVDEGMIHIHKPGIATITASQSGVGFTEAAEPVSRVLEVLRGEQIISFSPIGEYILGDAPFTLQAESNLGLPVSFTSDDPSVATIAGNVVTMLREGTVTIRAVQPGNELYESAEVSQVLVVKLVTGIEHELLKNTVYPNPTSGHVKVNLSEDAIMHTITLTDNAGRPVKIPTNAFTFSRNHVEINLTDIVGGIYFLHIKTARGAMVYKLIKI